MKWTDIMEKLVGVVLLAGELLLTCGAEMYRVEETIERMGIAAGFIQVESFATPTGLFLSLHASDGRVYTRVRRIRRSYNNLALISEINAISRAFSLGEINLEDVKKRLERLEKQGSPNNLKRHLIGGIGSAAFTLLYMGRALEAIIAGIVGAIVLLIGSKLEDYPIPNALQAAIGAIVAAGLVKAVALFVSINVNVTILGAVMVLAPGVVMTTAIRDMLSGELVSGVTRGAEALSIAVGIATGVAVILSIGGG